MINKSKLALIAALAIGVASPALAQALNKSDGTGSVSAFAYQPGGGKPTYEPGPGLVGDPSQPEPTITAQQRQQAGFAGTGARSLYAYAPHYGRTGHNRMVPSR